jgi:hypothetical protein
VYKTLIVTNITNKYYNKKHELWAKCAIESTAADYNIISSPELKAQKRYSDHLLFVIRPPINVYTFNFSRNKGPILTRISFGGGDSSLFR